MTQRERLPEDEYQTGAQMYQSGATTRQFEQPHVAHPVADDGTDVTLVTPVDKVRWGPVLAGLFAALSTLATLTVLGLAIGAQAFDPNDQASSFGLGAGIWAAISALIAFGIGGWFAARTAAVPGRSAGILNGAMVWFVAIPLLLYGITSGVGAIARTLGNVAGTAVTAAAPVAGSAANDPQAQASAAAGVGAAASAAGQAAQNLQQQAADPQNQEAVANTIADNAWRTLLSLGLAAAAAIGGGYLGSRAPTVATRRTSV